MVTSLSFSTEECPSWVQATARGHCGKSGGSPVQVFVMPEAAQHSDEQIDGLSLKVHSKYRLLLAEMPRVSFWLIFGHPVP